MEQPEIQSSELIRFADVSDFVREARRRIGRVEEHAEPPPFYRVALGLEAIQLGDMECA